MGAFSIWHWLIVLVVVLVLFGGSGKISSLMGDVAKGIKSFKSGMREGEKNGVDYVFLSREDFETRRDAGAFLEWADYNDNGDWKSSTSFGLSDLPNAIRCLQLAQEHVETAEANVAD